MRNPPNTILQTGLQAKYCINCDKQPQDHNEPQPMEEDPAIEELDFEWLFDKKSWQWWWSDDCGSKIDDDDDDTDLWN